MKEYWSIPGPSKSPNGPCIAFEKYDGNCIRAEWTKKNGWCKYGSRTVLIDNTSPVANAIIVFNKKYANDLDNVFRKIKYFRNIERVTAYMEYFGPNSFAGWHDPKDFDSMDVMLFDLNIHKKGMMLPRDFVNVLKNEVEIAKVIYEGNFNSSFVNDIRDGKYPVKEGVVAKGVLEGKGQHSLWMAKAKTKWWFDELRKRALMFEDMKKLLNENLTEQEMKV